MLKDHAAETAYSLARDFLGSGEGVSLSGPAVAIIDVVGCVSPGV